jgi:hypothetical protein
MSKRNENTESVVDTDFATPEPSEQEQADALRTDAEQAREADEGAEATGEVETTEDEQQVLDLSDLFDFQDGGSPYGLIISANKVFKALGWDKQLPTQYGYSATKTGAVDGEKHPTTAGVTFTRAQGLAWVTKYVIKNAPKQTAAA